MSPKFRILQLKILIANNLQIYGTLRLGDPDFLKSWCDPKYSLNLFVFSVGLFFGLFVESLGIFLCI